MKSRYVRSVRKEKWWVLREARVTFTREIAVSRIRKWLLMYASVETWRTCKKIISYCHEFFNSRNRLSVYNMHIVARMNARSRLSFVRVSCSLRQELKWANKYSFCLTPGSMEGKLARASFSSLSLLPSDFSSVYYYIFLGYFLQNYVENYAACRPERVKNCSFIRWYTISKFI